MAVVGTEFWGPILEAIEEVAVSGRQLISAEDWARMKLTDDVDALMDHLAGAHGVRGFEGDPDQLAALISREIVEAIDLLDRLPVAVTVIGGRRLSGADPACQALRAAAEILTQAGVPLRVGGASDMAEAVVAGVRAADPDATVQGFTTAGEDRGRKVDGVQLHMEAGHPITHKQLIGRRAKALVALPGGLGTLDELFSVLCQVQTGKLDKIPVVLVGEDYWRPIFGALRAEMLSGARQTIAPEDIELVTITDDPAEIARVAGILRREDPGRHHALCRAVRAGPGSLLLRQRCGLRQHRGVWRRAGLRRECLPARLQRHLAVPQWGALRGRGLLLAGDTAAERRGDARQRHLRRVARRCRRRLRVSGYPHRR